MGLQSFENGLERMVEGVFSRAFRSAVRPVELGRRLLREMDERRSVDVKGRRIVPNHFTFHLSAPDHAALAPIDEALVAELIEAAREYARDEGYHFMGPLAVEMQVDNNLKAGRFGITSMMKEGASGTGAGSLVMPSGERIRLGTQTTVFGRSPECTIVINDNNVSRRHAEVRPIAAGYVIADLGSTNGTKINGVRIDSERLLHDGDILSFGAVHVRFEAS